MAGYAGSAGAGASGDAEVDHLFKLLLVGDAGVGKSSILLRYTDGTFDDHLQSTIGVDFKVKHMTVRDKRVKLSVWDTAGQERFRTLTSSYYRGAQAILLVYDVSKRESFAHLGQWLQETELYCPAAAAGAGVVKVLVGNKVDRVDRAVAKSEGEAWARSKGMLFLETSAKTTVGIAQVFEEAVQKILDSPSLVAETAATRASAAGTARLDAARPADRDADGGGCCG